MALSDLTDIYESQSFKQLQKAQEAENQLKLALIERLNEVIRGFKQCGQSPQLPIERDFGYGYFVK